MKLALSITALLLSLAVTLQAVAETSPDAALDALHKAGADSDAAAFGSLLAEDVVFLGVAGAGRLEGQAARAYFMEQLAKGNAWAYSSGLREMQVSADGSVAWFDETLQSERLGNARGSGVLVRSGEGWKVVQYNLTVSAQGSATPASVGANSQPGAAPAVVSGSGAAGVQPAEVQEKKRCMMTSHKTNTRAKC